MPKQPSPSPRPSRLSALAGWGTAAILGIGISAALLSTRSEAVPVHDPAAISKLASQLSTMSRQIQQLTKGNELLDGIRSQFGTSEVVDAFKAGSGVLSMIDTGRSTKSTGQTPVEGNPWLDKNTGGTQAPSSGQTPVEGNPWLDKNTGGTGAPGSGQTPVSDRPWLEREVPGLPWLEKEEAPIQGPHRESVALEAEETSSMPRNRQWAAENFFVELRPGESIATESRALRRWRVGMVQEAAARGWAQASAGRKDMINLHRRQAEIAIALEDSQSIREDLSVVVAALAESTRAVAVGNAMIATDLEIHALAAIHGAPLALDERSRQALLGEIDPGP